MAADKSKRLAWYCWYKIREVLKAQNLKRFKKSGFRTDLDLPLFSDRQRQREDAERVEGDRDFVALGADDGGLEEAVEQVQDDRVVPALVDLPCFPGNLLVKRTSELNWVTRDEL